MTKARDTQDRLKKALRENLQRRKAQKRERDLPAKQVEAELEKKTSDR